MSEHPGDVMRNGWDPASYKTAYEGFDDLARFPTALALAEYRQMLLDETERETAFVARHLGRRKLRVMDIGAGNGRLLVRLALEGMLEFGLGVEISRSRVAFAQQWVRDLGLSNIEMVATDAVGFDAFEPASFDLVTCMSDTFSYLRPIRETAPAELLSRIRAALKTDGCLLLQVYQISEARKLMLALGGGRLRVWQPLPPQDRFAYYLSDFEYAAEREILIHRKTFVARDGAIDAGRSEVLGYCTKDRLVTMLREAGFEPPQVHADFTGAAYREGDSEVLVTLAGTPAWHDRDRSSASDAAAVRSRKDGPGALVPRD
jgi:SAM-dependent methyltransferase